MAGPVFVDLDGMTVEGREAERLRHPMVAGVILFERNFESPDQLRELVAEVRRIRSDVLVTVDQEGGRVQRFRTGLTRLPAAARFGALHDADPGAACRLAHAAGWTMAGELAGLGVDLSFAPVLDLFNPDSGVIGDRAFHGDPTVVTDLAESFIAGMSRAGMAATGKHFPGHGGVGADSHLELPRDRRGMAAIEAADLVPYRRLAHDMLGAVMTAHVAFEAVDPAPPTYSQRWLRQVLRQRIGFRGAVFSDDLAMAGAAWAGGPAERGRRALDAGCDLLLLCNDPDQSDALLAGIEFRPDRQWQRRVEALRIRTSPRGSVDPSLAEARAAIAAMA
jgi:beta-N-acetylhexosaminidase